MPIASSTKIKPIKMTSSTKKEAKEKEETLEKMAI